MQNSKEGWLFKPARRAYEQDTLGRYEDLRPNKKRKHPKPDWQISKKRQEAIDKLTKELEYPSQWPEVSVLFEFGGGMSTTEALLKLGPVGQYQISFADCEAAFKAHLVELFPLLGSVMYKTSTPAERMKLQVEGARLFTKLEMALPSAWNTFVTVSTSSSLAALSGAATCWTTNACTHC
jgi:hypothetical protein